MLARIIRWLFPSYRLIKWEHLKQVIEYTLDDSGEEKHYIHEWCMENDRDPKDVEGNRMENVYAACVALWRENA